MSVGLRQFPVMTSVVTDAGGDRGPIPGCRFSTLHVRNRRLCMSQVAIVVMNWNFTCSASGVMAGRGRVAKKLPLFLGCGRALRAHRSSAGLAMRAIRVLHPFADRRSATSRSWATLPTLVPSSSRTASVSHRYPPADNGICRGVQAMNHSEGPSRLCWQVRRLFCARVRL